MQMYPDWDKASGFLLQADTLNININLKCQLTYVCNGMEVLFEDELAIFEIMMIRRVG